MNLEDDILIENFLRGNLSKEEKADFLKRIENDSDFKEHFQFEKELFETLDENNCNTGNHNSEDVDTYKKLFINSDTQELKSAIEKASNAYKAPEKKNNSNKWILYLSAAMITLFFTINSLIPQSLTSEELYASYIQKMELPSLIERSDNKTDLGFGQKLFEEKKYEDALNIFKVELKNAKTLNANVLLYTGITQMELNQFNDAEETFNRLINSDFLDAPKGKWYKALLYLKKGDKSGSKQLLKEIIESSSFNHIKAKKLLKELE